MCSVVRGRQSRVPAPAACPYAPVDRAIGDRRTEASAHLDLRTGTATTGLHARTIAAPTTSRIVPLCLPAATSNRAKTGVPTTVSRIKITVDEGPAEQPLSNGLVFSGEHPLERSEGG